jgi:ATP-dependent helicase/nuclease subunit B
MHHLLAALDDLARAHAGAPVRFVAREVPFARELVRALAQRRGALVGWEATTLRQLAGELAAPALDAAGLRPASDLALQAAAEEALDATAARLPAPLARQVPTLGFRVATYDAFAELRVGGVTPEALRAAARPGSPAFHLAPAYARYVALLAERQLADAGAVLAAAVTRAADATALDAVVIIEPVAADVSGLARTFVEALVARGAVVPAVPMDPPAWGAPGPEPRLVRAATPALEVRAALRDALANGRAWDRIELAVTDVDTYGTALAAIGDELGIAYTLKEGVPMIRSRAGRALERYLAWIEADYPARPVREALEQGELPVSDGAIAPADVARALREAQVGWGRARWIAAAAHLRAGGSPPPRRGRDGDADEAPDPGAAARHAAIASATATLMEQLVACMPGADDDAPITTGTLAAHARAWLALVAPALDAPGERHALERLARQLDALASDDARRAGPRAAAVAEVRLALAGLRAFPSVDGERAGRVSAPGSVHLTQASQAGASGRAHVCLLGFDADRLQLASGGDPLLDDGLRARLGGAVPTLRERAERRERALHMALRGLTGPTWLSYATLADGAGREASPAPLVLEAARHALQRPALTYAELRTALGEPAGAARGPRGEAVTPLDARDRWLAAIAGSARPLDARAVVDAAFPPLARGVALHAQATADVVGAWHGLVPAAAMRTGPFAPDAPWISASGLEMLGRCPLAWFYRYALGLRAPEEAEPDPSVWLDAAQFGTLLHTVLERFVRDWHGRQGALDGAEAEAALAAIADEAVAALRASVPAPNAAVVAATRERLGGQLRRFLAQERDDRLGRWHAVEFHFPPPGATATFTASDGTVLPIGGFVDRVDRLPDGAWRVVDYKSGSGARFRPGSKEPPLKGGRLMQPAWYAAGIAQALGGPVASVEYRFPREAAPRDRVRVDDATLAAAPALVTSLLTHLRTGDFVPTDEAGDCTWCDFRTICQVRIDGFTTESPRAAWGDAHGAGAPAYVELRRRRGRDDDAPAEDA